MPRRRIESRRPARGSGQRLARMQNHGHVDTRTSAAAAPSTSHPALGVAPCTPMTRLTRPAKTIPCPRRRRPIRPSARRSARASLCSAQAEIPTSANALATPASESPEQPRGDVAGQAHRECCERDPCESRARGGPRARVREHAHQRAGEVAGVVGGREPSALRKRQARLRLHQRQERREREAADAHRCRQSEHADDDRGHRRNCLLRLHGDGMLAAEFSHV